MRGSGVVAEVMSLRGVGYGVMAFARGRHDQDVDRFLTENRIWIGWGQDIHQDFRQFKTKPTSSHFSKKRKPSDSAMKRASAVGKLLCFAQK